MKNSDVAQLDDEHARGHSGNEYQQGAELRGFSLNNFKQQYDGYNNEEVGRISEQYQSFGGSVGGGGELTERERQYLRVISQKMKLVEEFEQRQSELRNRRANLQNNLSLSFAQSERGAGKGNGGTGNSNNLSNSQLLLGENSSQNSRSNIANQLLSSGHGNGGAGGWNNVGNTGAGRHLLGFQKRDLLQQTSVTSIGSSQQNVDNACTFQPEINKNSASLSHRNKTNQDYMVQYLYSDALERKEKQRQEELQTQSQTQMMTNRSQIDQKSQQIVYKKIESTLQSMLDALDDADNQNFISFENVGYFLEQLGVFKALQFRRNNDETSLFMADRAKVDVQRLHQEMQFHEQLWRILGNSAENVTLVPTRNVFDFIMILLENKLQVKQAVALLKDVLETRKESQNLISNNQDHRGFVAGPDPRQTRDYNIEGETVHQEVELEDREDEGEETGVRSGNQQQKQQQRELFNNQISNGHHQNNKGGNANYRNNFGQIEDHGQEEIDELDQYQVEEDQFQQYGNKRQNQQEGISRNQNNRRPGENNGKQQEDNNDDEQLEQEYLENQNDNYEQNEDGDAEGGEDRDAQEEADEGDYNNFQSEEPYSEQLRRGAMNYQQLDTNLQNQGKVAPGAMQISNQFYNNQQKPNNNNSQQTQNQTNLNLNNNIAFKPDQQENYLNGSPQNQNTTSPSRANRGSSNEWTVQQLVLAFRRLHDDQTTLMEWYSTRRDQLLSDMSVSSQVNHTLGGQQLLNPHNHANKEQTFHPQINKNSRNLDKALNENYISKIILNSTHNPEKLEQFKTRYDLLFQHSKFLMQKKEQKRVNIEMAELDQCSFIPSINKSAVLLNTSNDQRLPEQVPVEQVSKNKYKQLSSMSNNSNNSNNQSNNGKFSGNQQQAQIQDKAVFDRLYEVSRFKNQKIKEYKELLDKQREVQEISECTFKPNINQYSINSGGNHTSTSVLSNSGHGNSTTNNGMTTLMTSQNNGQNASIYEINGVRQSMSRYNRARQDQIDKELFWEKKRNDFNNHDPTKLTQHIPFEFQKGTNKSTQSVGQFLGNVDVNLSKGKKGRITIHRGDDPEQLAANFAQIYSLHDEMQFTLQQMIAQYMKKLEESS